MLYGFPGVKTVANGRAASAPVEHLVIHRTIARKQKKNVSNKLIFFKKSQFWGSEKIYSDSSKYCANFRYIVKVGTWNLREIWFIFKSDARGITIFDQRRRAQSPLMMYVLLSTFSKTLSSKSDEKWLFIILWSLYTHDIWIL